MSKRSRRRGGGKRGRTWVSIDPELKEFLVREFGSLSKAIEKLGEEYKKSLGPENPRLRRAWESLLKHAGKGEKIPWRDAVLTVEIALGVDEERAVEILQDLCELGYLETVETGILKVRPKRELPPALKFLLG